jgi:regulator of extracellular matrix RemA (YlzA/DUF370 family)
MKKEVMNIGFGNLVVISRIVAILVPGSSPMRRLKEESKKNGKLIDATHGRRCRSILITDSNHTILSPVQVDTIGQRFCEERAKIHPTDEG